MLRVDEVVEPKRKMRSLVEVGLNIIMIISAWRWSTWVVNCKSSKSSVEAVYVFGDSLVDTGNMNWLPVPIYYKANFLPYGIDFASSTPTGRYTNGLTVPDLLAQYFELPFPTNVKQPNLPPSLTGYNYASGGSGILPQTGHPNGLPLTEQVRLFHVTKETVLRPAFPDEARLEYHLANSIFFIWTANNDFLLNYFYPSSNSSEEYTPPQFVRLLTRQLSDNIQSLHSLGARKIVVFEGPPYGCIPPIYVLTASCNATMNAISLLYNNHLEEMIASLSSQLTDAYISLGKAYDLTYDAFIHPSSYGFTNSTGTCCKLARVFGETTSICRPWSRPCTNRDEYLFWDGVHPTEAANRVLSGQCITNSSICTPYSIQDLAQITISPTTLHTTA